MIDKYTKSSTKIESLSPSFQPRIKQFIKDAKKLGYDVLIISGYRTKEEQDFLFATGKTQTKGGNSLHNIHMAADINCFGKTTLNSHTSVAEWKNSGIVDAAKKNNIHWGGDFKTPDVNHFYIKNI